MGVQGGVLAEEKEKTRKRKNHTGSMRSLCYNNKRGK